MAKILISMPDKFLESIDKIANDEQRTRSELIREALRTYLKTNHMINSKRALKNAEILDGLLD
ncbi:MAG: ribbon-helix-helix domain-containing protein [bacterium]|nr:ribbon-helix-helix domain-containing protein [bacterium]